MNFLHQATHLEFKAEIDLPFPTNPGLFWAEAIKAIYGPGHLLLGVGTSNVTHPDGSPMDVGPLLCGLIFTVGVGASDQGGILPAVQVKLDLLDLKMVNWNGALALEYDTTKPGQDCSLVTLDPQKVFNKFVDFANPLHWPHLAKEFLEHPKAFFEKHIEIFYPAGININFNVKGSIGHIGEAITGIVGGRHLVNHEPIWICCGNVPTFPPKNLGLCPRDPVILVDESNPTTAVAVIQKVETIWMHPAIEEKSELLICQPAVAGALTYDFIRDMVHQFLNPPKWP